MRHNTPAGIPAMAPDAPAKEKGHGLTDLAIALHIDKATDKTSVHFKASGTIPEGQVVPLDVKQDFRDAEAALEWIVAQQLQFLFALKEYKAMRNSEPCQCPKCKAERGECTKPTEEPKITFALDPEDQPKDKPEPPANA